MENITEWPTEFDSTETRGEPLFTLTFPKNKVPREILLKIFGSIPESLEQHIAQSEDEMYTMTTYCYSCTYPPSPIGGGHFLCSSEYHKCWPCEQGSCF